MVEVKNYRLQLNNFDLLRFLFALIVCLVHAYKLSGYQDLSILNKILSSEVAVEAFFVISGFLIFMSYERSSSIRSYAIKRVRRILPGYILVLLVCAFGLLTISSLPYQDYFSFVWLKYVIVNLGFMNFIQPSLPGVFDGNNFNPVNGSLWTLKIEVMFYFSVPIFVCLIKRFGCFPVLGITYLLSIMYVFILSMIAEITGSEIYTKLGRQLPGQLSYFMAGAFFYYFFEFFEKHIKVFVATAVLALYINYSISLPFIEPFAIATIVIFFSLFLYVGNFGKFGDASYGLYIIHFPITQIFLSQGWLKENPWLFLLSIIFITLILSYLLWHLVEKKFLKRAVKNTTLSGSHCS